jgi:hypothetical protein
MALPCFFTLLGMLLVVVPAGVVQAGEAFDLVLSLRGAAAASELEAGRVSLATNSGLLEVWCRAWPAVKIL